MKCVYDVCMHHFIFNYKDKMVNDIGMQAAQHDYVARVGPCMCIQDIIDRGYTPRSSYLYMFKVL